VHRLARRFTHSHTHTHTRTHTCTRKHTHTHTPSSRTTCLHVLVCIFYTNGILFAGSVHISSYALAYIYIYQHTCALRTRTQTTTHSVVSSKPRLASISPLHTPPPGRAGVSEKQIHIPQSDRHIQFDFLGGRVPVPLPLLPPCINTQHQYDTRTGAALLFVYA